MNSPKRNSGPPNRTSNISVESPRTPTAPSLPNYLIKELIGKGTFGTVYKAYKKGLGDVVAIKVMSLKGLSKQGKENLFTEIKILKKIKHKFIVNLIDFEWDENYIYLIFEYCSAGELSNLIKTKKRLEERVVKHFLQQIALALKALREEGVAHMDLKPQNILLSNHKGSSQEYSPRNTIIKIADFGLSQFMESDCDTASSFRGSPLYMAPEIILKRKYDARCDLWSVGIILYECLFGEPPFKSSSTSGIIEKIKDPRPIEIPPRNTQVKISTQCRDLLKRLLKRNPEERITYDEFFAHPYLDLEHFPCPESYQKGVKFIARAVKKDADGEFREAFKSYEAGLQYLVPIYEWGDGQQFLDERKANDLKGKLLEYMSRAEQLKAKISVFSDEDRQTAESAYDDIFEADQLAQCGAMKEALELYSNALEALVPLLPKLKGQEKEDFYHDLSFRISKAEEMKALLKSHEQVKGPNSRVKSQSMKQLPNSGAGPKPNEASSSKYDTVPSLRSKDAPINGKSSRSKSKVTAIPTTDFVVKTFLPKDSLSSSPSNCYVQ